MSRARERIDVKAGRARLIHVETKLGYINIHLGLHDMEGHDVEAVVVVSDNDTIRRDPDIGKIRLIRSKA